MIMRRGGYAARKVAADAPCTVPAYGQRRCVSSLPAKTRSELSDPANTVVTVSDVPVRALLAGTQLDPYAQGARQFLGVADANALLSCVGNDCRKGPQWRSGLLRMTAGGAATLYASEHVYWEVYEHLADISRWSKVPASVLRERFEENYLPMLRFVSVDASEIVDSQVLAITDLDDVPSGQLAKLIAPCVVFSEDRHLRKPGLAPENWRQVAEFGVDLVEAALDQHALRQDAHAASLPVLVGVEVARWLGRRTGLPPWLIGTATAGAALYLLRKPERREAVGRHVIPLLKAHAHRTEKAAAQERRGLQGIREVMLPSPAAPPVKQQAAIVLARQREPLLAREVQERMLAHFPAEIVPAVTEIRTVLKDSPEFISYERSRWQFGREGAPWRGGA